MMMITLVLADTLLIAVQRKAENPRWEKTGVDALLPDEPYDPPWDVRLSDMLTGKQHSVEMTTEQIQAITTLAVAGDDAIFVDAMKAYHAVGTVLDNCPPECRPIP